MNIQRRRFITQFATTAAGRCLLGPVAASLASGNAWAQQEAAPKFAAFITPLGRHRDWLPDGTGQFSDFTTESKPLEKHASDITIVKETNSILRHFGADGAHRAGYPGATTGHVDPDATDVDGPVPGLGPSIDQHLIQGWGNGAQSLQLGVLPSGGNDSILSWAGDRNPLTPERNARRVYDTVFQSLSGSAQEQAAIRFRDQSILDQWTKELQQLKADLGSVHREVFDQHLTHIEEIEKRLNENLTESGSASCAASLNITNDDNFYTQNDSYPEIGKQMMDIIALAFACGQHQTATLAWSDAGSFVVPRWVLGANARNHHTITHAADVDQAWDDLSKIEIWYNEQFSYLIDKLAQTLDLQGGRLLDSTILYWTSETGSARSHSGAALSAVFAGNYKNRLRNGVLLDHDRQPLNDILSTIATVLDVPTNKFGNTDFSTGQHFNDMLA